MKKKFKNRIQKYEFLNDIIENEYIPTEKELKKLYILGRDKDSSIRLDVTEALQMF